MSIDHVTEVQEAPRLIGNPTRAVCSCGYVGTRYSFGSPATRREHAELDAELHERIMDGRERHAA